MTFELAMDLVKRHADRGNPKCDHPKVVPEERVVGWDSGDELCLICGASAPKGTLQAADKNA